MNVKGVLQINRELSLSPAPQNTCYIHLGRELNVSEFHWV